MKNWETWIEANTGNTHTKRPTGGAHNKGTDPGKKVECYSYGLTGHFKGAMACKGRSVRKLKSNHVSDPEEKDNKGDKTDSLQRIHTGGESLT